MKYKLVIFDLDGVIVNTEPIHFEAYKLTLKKYGIDLDFDTYNKKLRSRGRHIGLADIMGNLTEKEITRIGSEKDIHFLELISSKPDLFYEDALMLIDYCKKQYIPMGIATASHKGKTLLQSYDMTEWFDYVVTAQDVNFNKPNPEIYNKCKAYFEIDNEDILVIEDSEAGVKAALEADLNVVFIKRDKAPMLSESLINSEKVTLYYDLNKLRKE